MFCGIDFGTTNSTIALAKTGEKPQLVSFPNGKNTIPTAIFYPGERNAKPLFGDDAVSAYIAGEPGRFMRSMKRILGSDLMSSGTIINNSFVHFHTILEYFVRHLKEHAENYCDENLDSVVMGRPVRFRNNDPEGDKRAQDELEKITAAVGFKNIQFQFEPIAAAYAHEIELQDECIACVVDIGGGTSDFTVIRLGPKLKNKIDRTDDVLANSGVRIGGNDFDKNLSIKCFMPEFGFGTLGGGKIKYDKILPLSTVPYYTLSEWSKVNSMYVPKEINFIRKMLFSAQEPEKVKRLLELVENEKGHILLSAVEKTKIQLTEHDDIDITLKFISDNPKINVHRNEFEESMQYNMGIISQSLDECISQSQIKPENIQMVILTGGSTEIPALQNMVKEYFPNAKISQENKLSSVGLGLAYDSLRRFINFRNNENILRTTKNLYDGR